MAGVLDVEGEGDGHLPASVHPRRSAAEEARKARFKSGALHLLAFAVVGGAAKVVEHARAVKDKH